MLRAPHTAEAAVPQLFHKRVNTYLLAYELPSQRRTQRMAEHYGYFSVGGFRMGHDSYIYTGGIPCEKSFLSDMSTFPDTQWTLILQAATSQTADGLVALDQLCRRYWQPINAYARLQGYSPADADDITQAFFARLLENKTHAKAERERGRFRTFLLCAMQNFIANDHRDAARQKRGGGFQHEAIEDHADQIATSQTPEKLFAQKWAQAVVASAISELEAEYAANGRAARFEVMRQLLTVRHDGDTAALAAQLGVTTMNFRKILHGFRQRFGELVREEVARLVSDPAEVDDELAYLMQALG